MTGTSSRRDFLKTSTLGLGAMGVAAGALASAAPAAAEVAPPTSDLQMWVTFDVHRFASYPSIRWQPIAEKPAVDSIRVDPYKTYQDIWGFGASFTDGACYTLNRMDPANRERLLHEFFDPSKMGLSVGRTCIGSSDCSTKVFSYDEGDPDPELKRFSIDHDREYILPVLRQARKINPDLYLFSSPWSPPGWMKWNNSMLGGSMPHKYLGSYAQYFLKFLQGYEAEGVRIQAVTIQNEIDTDQNGIMPACTWAQETELDFICQYLGPLLEKTKTPTEIWILDHNFSLWGRVVCVLDDPDARRYTNSVAWHGYAGVPEMMSRVHELHPDANFYFTEAGANYGDADVMTNWSKWSAIFAGAMNNWCRAVLGWNLVLDEKGKPNIGPYACAGLASVDTHTQEILRTGPYWALYHYSHAVKRGARRIDSQSSVADLQHVAFENPNGQKVLVITSAGQGRTIRLHYGESTALVPIHDDSVTTLVWS
jgi:glucosylceramidase